MHTLLVVDDDPALAALLAEYLASRGLRVITAHSGAEGLQVVARGGVDLVVLDVMMPQMDGFDVLRALRRDSTLPVVMLTARGDDLDRIIGLEIGADDYLAKPFNPRELLARVNAVLRRSTAPERDSSALVAAGIRLDPERREVRVDDVLVELTTTEFELLRTLMASAGRVIPRERLMELARGEEWAAFERSVDVHISRLRKKLGDDSRNPLRIKTIRGVGYLVPRDK